MGFGELGSDFAGEFGKSFISMVWDGDLGIGLSTGAKRTQAEVESILQFYAPQVENWMKTNAPWTDQTSAARNGLAARYYNAGTETGIILYHQVPYGIWLEVRFSGRYAIIGPALEHWGDRVMSGMKNMLERI